MVLAGVGVLVLIGAAVGVTLAVAKSGGNSGPNSDERRACAFASQLLDRYPNARRYDNEALADLQAQFSSPAQRNSTADTLASEDGRYAHQLADLATGGSPGLAALGRTYSAKMDAYITDYRHGPGNGFLRGMDTDIRAAFAALDAFPAQCSKDGVKGT